MNGRKSIFISAMLLLLMIYNSPLNAAWPVEGILVCGEEGEQVYSKVVSDGAGGMIAAWRDYRTGIGVYTQRLDGSGKAMWADGGINLSPGVTGVLVDIVSDDAGGAIVIWCDSDAEEVMATHIGPDGTFPWGAGGVIVDTPALAYDIVAAEDGSGGALIAYRTDTWHIVQRIDEGGTAVWPGTGFPYTSIDIPDGYEPDLVSDGAGGALIAFMDDDPSLPGVYVQRVYANGNKWSSSGTKADYTTGADYPSYYPAVTLDGAGGAYVAWQYGDPGIRIYAQKIDPAGTPVFDSVVQVCTVPYSHERPDIMSDGVGGACIVWRGRIYTTYDIYAQRLDAYGTPLWGYGTPLWEDCGIPVNQAEVEHYDALLVSADSEGFIVGWIGAETGRPFTGYPLSAQRIDMGGDVGWTTGGAELFRGDAPGGCSFIADGSGGVMAVAPRYRPLGTERDVYAQVLNSFGLPSAPEPVITAVDDVPGDQGGWLRLTIGASDRDRLDQVFEQVTLYDIWQRIDDPLALSAIDTVSGSKSAVKQGITLLECDSRRLIVAAPGGAFPDGTWEAVGSFGASQADQYTFRASTLADMVGTQEYYSVYAVTARTDDPSVWFVSAPDSGCSVDNLEPDPPLGLEGEQSYSPEGIELTWDPNIEDDLWYYTVYRGNGGTPAPGMAQLIATPQTTDYFDASWEWEEEFWYLVTAVDIHGNESDFAVLAWQQVTGDDTPETPAATFLARNFPNPFNPSTSIGFGLRDACHVSLRVYDPAGRLVKVLVDGRREAAVHSERWNGTDDSGRPVASGVYFCRLTAGGFDKTRKMVLLR